jgi:hypothetical protein
MTFYSFVRFVPVAARLANSNYADIVKQHERHLTQLENADSVITEAVFGEKSGGILIVKGEIKLDAFKDDPAVKEGFFTIDTKKLFIAKGSFCEK